MSKWPTLDLGEVVTSGGGKIHTGPFGSQLHASDYVDDGIPCIMPANMKDNRVDLSSIAYIADKDAQRLSKYLVQSGDIVYSRRGDVTQKALISEQEAGYFCGTGCLLIRPGNKIDPDFLAAYLSTNTIKDWIRQQAVGATMPNLNTGILLRVPYSAPDKLDQSRRSRIVKLLNQKIALNNKINTELEAMAKLIYDYWFVQFDFPDANGKPYKSSGGKMVYNEALKREIPEGWEVKELSRCVDTILDHRGKTPKKLGGNWTEEDNGIIALSAKLVKAGKLRNLEKANKVDQALFDKWMPEKLQDGDILMTSEAPAGEFYFIHGKTDYCMSQRLFAIRGNQELLASTYLYYELSKGHGYSQILGSLSGSTVFGIRQDVLRTIKVVVPELALQQRFDGIVMPQLKQIKNLEQENLELSKLRDWLLPMLMNGQVTIK